MKKLILLILTMSIIFVSKAEGPDTSKLTIEKVYSDVKAGITGLAQALKVPAERVYSVIIKQQIVIAVSWLTLLLLSFFSIVNWLLAYKSKEEWNSHGDPTGIGIVRIIQITISSLILILSTFFIEDILTGFINPEYGALKDIVDFIK